MQKRLGFVLGCGIAVGALGVINVLPAKEAAATGLVSFDSCSEVLSHLKEEARERANPWGFGGVYGHEGMVQEEAGDAVTLNSAPSDGAASDDASAGAAAAQQPFSTTNVQEADVDEPDTVKTDGRLLVTTIGSTLRVVDVTGDEPEQVGELSVAEEYADTSLFLAGDRAVVFANEEAMALEDSASSFPLWGSMKTTMHIVDLSDPADPTIESTLRVDGNYLDARLVDGTVRVAISSPPTLKIPMDKFSEGPDEDAALEQLRKTIDNSGIEDWVPSYSLVTEDGDESSGQLVSCDQLNRPDDFAGFSTVSVLTFGTDGFSVDDTVGVLTDGETVYASTDRFYVATTRWAEPVTGPEPVDGFPVTPDPTEPAIDPESAGDIAVDPEASDDVAENDIAAPVPPQQTTERTGIHAFDIEGDDPAEYLASGEVKGSMIGQYAMSEYDGVLRVATTTTFDANSGASESQLITLTEKDGELKQLGKVGGLGKDERIYAVRYFGDTAYVVTFRETDPLYVLDLSDPAAPSVEGELKITGYSSYLHDVGADRLVGVGQEATNTGTTIGSQVSLFDVADPADPRKLDGHVTEGGWSDAESDPHAFLYWQDTQQLVIPMYKEPTSESGFDEAEPTGGALVLSVDGDTLREDGMITHGPAGRPSDDAWSSIMRSVVIGDSIYTLWPDGLQVNDLDSLEFQDWLPMNLEW